MNRGTGLRRHLTYAERFEAEWWLAVLQHFDGETSTGRIVFSKGEWQLHNGDRSEVIDRGRALELMREHFLSMVFTPPPLTAHLIAEELLERSEVAGGAWSQPPGPKPTGLGN